MQTSALMATFLLATELFIWLTTTSRKDSELKFSTTSASTCCWPSCTEGFASWFSGFYVLTDQIKENENKMSLKWLLRNSSFLLFQLENQDQPFVFLLPCCRGMQCDWHHYSLEPELSGAHIQAGARRWYSVGITMGWWRLRQQLCSRHCLWRFVHQNFLRYAE